MRYLTEMCVDLIATTHDYVQKKSSVMTQINKWEQWLGFLSQYISMRFCFNKWLKSTIQKLQVYKENTSLKLSLILINDINVKNAFHVFHPVNIFYVEVQIMIQQLILTNHSWKMLKILCTSVENVVFVVANCAVPQLRVKILMRKQPCADYTLCLQVKFCWTKKWTVPLLVSPGNCPSCWNSPHVCWIEDLHL